jgi:hypothetical protein
MVTLEYGEKVRVSCPVERTDENYREQDEAFNVALNRHRLEYLRGQIEAEKISTYELVELQGLVEYIEPGDVQLLEWAGVPEDSGCDCGEADSGAHDQPYIPNGKIVIRKRKR